MQKLCRQFILAVLSTAFHLHADDFFEGSPRLRHRPRAAPTVSTEFSAYILNTAQSTSFRQPAVLSGNG